MTKKLTSSSKQLMQLDLDSFLDSDSDDESSSVPHRTVDEILNASDSSTTSSPPPSPPSVSHGKSDFHHSRPRAEPSPRLDDAVSEVSGEPSMQSRFDSRPGSLSHVSDQIQRISSSSSSSSRYSRQFPSLFDRVRSNAKPGAALAAAAAASRSLPTRHAAIIKSRRAHKAWDVIDSGPSAVGDDQQVSSSNEDSGVISVVDVQYGGSLSSGGEFSTLGDVWATFKRESDEDLAYRDKDAEVMHDIDEELAHAHDSMLNKSHENADAPTSLSNTKADSTIKEDSSIVESESHENADAPASDRDDLMSSHLSDSRKIVSSGTGNDKEGALDKGDDKEGSTEEDLVTKDTCEDNVEKDLSSNDGIAVTSAPDDDDGGSSASDISELVEERIEQLESEIRIKREEQKSRAFRKPLELAEEFEKKQAYTGLHWEEGAAAQPMRLEGVRRGSTTLGFFDIDANNLITRTISAQPFQRDNGSPQVLAVHMNHIAVGMSKGIIILVPSRYTPRSADHMDPKVVFFGLQGDRSVASVTSMRFNQQGDILIAGYSDGNVTLWDVQKASALKIITGEHNAPVVHTLFLGRDSPVTRQFKAITGDSKGIVFLHTFSVVPLLNMFSVKTQCLLDGQRNGTVLSMSPLLLDDFGGSALPASLGNTATSSGSIGSMVGGVVGVDSGWKLFNEGPSVVEEGVVIFVTYQTALVVRLIPNLEVYAQLPRPEGVREGSMPYTAWKCTMQSPDSSAEASSVEATEKVSFLAIAWDRKVQVAKLVKSELKVCGKWSVDSPAIGLAWLDDQTLVVLTLIGHLHLFARDGTMIHRTNFSVDGYAGDDLVSYHTCFVNVFGNPEKSYHNCIAVRGASIYILGPTHLVVSRLLLWKERIDVLRKAGDWMGALNMALILYDGQAYGVIDLPRAVDAAREAIMPYLVELLLSYADEVFSYISVAFSNQIEKFDLPHETRRESNAVHSGIKEQYNRVGGVAVEFCVHIKRMDVLFEEIFSKFVAVGQRDTFLELLEPYILKDMLGSLPPEIMQALVEHYSGKGWLQRVEQCVLHMNISSLDFNQVVKICRVHGLYGALIYLFNKGLDDFRSPLEELLVILRNSPRESAGPLGYRTLVYLKYCFLGLAFPPGQGSLPASRLPSLRVELVQFLLEESDAHNSPSSSSLMVGSVCLNLYHLLKLDAEATLDVIRCAFGDTETPKPDSSQVDYVDTSAKSELKDGLPETGNSLVQATIDALVQIIDGGTPCNGGSSNYNGLELGQIWPSKEDMGHLYEFVAHYVARGRASVSKNVLSQIFEYLTSETSLLKAKSSRKRENQVLLLLKVVPEVDWEASYVLQLCERAQFYRVCGFAFRIRHQYVAALDSYMRDTDEPIHAFCFIDYMLSQLSGDEYATFRAAVVSRIPQLFELSREGSFLLIIGPLKDEASNILAQLHSHSRSLFLYLKTAIEVHLSGNVDFFSLKKEEIADLAAERRVKDLPEGCDAYLERLYEFPKFIRNNPVTVTDDMIKLYFELLCKFERNSVLKFLETFDNYLVEPCLRLCQEYGIIDAAAFLLERIGDFGSALLLTLSGLNDKFIALDAAVEGVASDMGSNRIASLDLFNHILQKKEVQDIRDVLDACIGLCQRNTPRLSAEESEALWFRLLDTFCQPLMVLSHNQWKAEEVYQAGKLAESVGFQEDKEACVIKWKITRSHRCANILRKLFSRFIKEIVEGMIGYVRLPIVMSKLLSDNGGQEFGDFKLTIMGMLGTYGFERRILDTAKSVIEDDTFYTMSLLKKGASHGYAPQGFLCCICNCPLAKNSSSLRVRVFICGHATHLQCDISENESTSQVSSSGCPVCMPKKATHSSRNKSISPEYGLVSAVSATARPSLRIAPYSHDGDAIDNSSGFQQTSRYEILSNLQKDQKRVQIENVPQLRLAPPAVYHEKVKGGTDFVPGESSRRDTKPQKPTRNRRDKEPKGSYLRFSKFRKEKTNGR